MGSGSWKKPAELEEQMSGSDGCDVLWWSDASLSEAGEKNEPARKRRRTIGRGGGGGVKEGVGGW